MSSSLQGFGALRGFLILVTKKESKKGIFIKDVIEVKYAS